MSILRELASALGGEVSGNQVLCPGPGHSARDRSLAVYQSVNAPGGFTVHSFAGDPWRDCRDYVAQRIGQPTFELRRGRRSGDPTSPDRFTKGTEGRKLCDLPLRLWRKASPINGTLGERYLRDARSIGCALPPTMRFLPATSKHPATVVTAFAIPAEPEPSTISMAGVIVSAIHRTLLDPDGKKIDKKFLGSPAGLPLVLGPWTDSLGLVIAEGIEDALSAHQAMDIAAWAAGSATHLPKIADAVPRWCDSVAVLVDDDEAGRRGAGELVDRLRHRGISADLLGPF
ncbi:MAG: toprim domain-containing protein [Pseudomonadota bacterium]